MARIAESGGTLALLLVILVLARSADYVLYVRLSHNLGHYAWFFGSIVLSLIYVVISWPFLWIKNWWVARSTRLGGIDPVEATRAGEDEESRRIASRDTGSSSSSSSRSKKSMHGVYLLIGILDAMGNIIGTIGASRVEGPLQVVLAQIIIPVNMILSFVLLRTRYRLNHFLGVFFILAGVFVALVPSLKRHDSTPKYTAAPGLKTTAQQDSTNSVQWIIFLLISIVPSSFSNIVKEKFLKRDDVDVLHFNAWTCTYQLGYGILTAPVVFSPFLVGADAYVKPSMFFTYIKNSTMCILAGRNADPTDHCANILATLGVYIFFNIVFNFILLFIFKLGSATLAVIASALRVALSAVLFQWRLLAGSAYSKLYWYDIVSLVILLAGLVLYRIRDEEKAKDPRAGRGGGQDSVRRDQYQRVGDDDDDNNNNNDDDDDPGHSRDGSDDGDTHSRGRRGGGGGSSSSKRASSSSSRKRSSSRDRKGKKPTVMPEQDSGYGDLGPEEEEEEYYGRR